jgi:hypothetical protein
MLDANCNTSLTRKTVHPNRRYTQKISKCFIQGSMARQFADGGVLIVWVLGVSPSMQISPITAVGTVGSLRRLRHRSASEGRGSTG